MSKNRTNGISDTLTSITSGVKRLGMLYLRKGRLQATEKITILLSTLAFTAVVLALAMVLLVFITIGVGHLLATTVAPHWAYLFVAGFYLVVLVLTVVLRRKLFIDPIARFMSRLLIDAPKDESDAPMMPRRRHKEEVKDSDAVPTPDMTEGDPDDEYDEIARRIALLLRKGESSEEEPESGDETVEIVEIVNNDPDLENKEGGEA